MVEISVVVIDSGLLLIVVLIFPLLWSFWIQFESESSASRSSPSVIRSHNPSLPVPRFFPSFLLSFITPLFPSFPISSHSVDVEFFFLFSTGSGHLFVHFSYCPFSSCWFDSFSFFFSSSTTTTTTSSSSPIFPHDYHGFVTWCTISFRIIKRIISVIVLVILFFFLLLLLLRFGFITATPNLFFPFGSRSRSSGSRCSSSSGNNNTTIRCFFC